MIRFHHGINGGPVLDIYVLNEDSKHDRRLIPELDSGNCSSKDLLVAKLAPFETSVYANVDDRVTVRGYAGTTLVFTLRYDANCKSTAVIFVENTAVQLRLERDMTTEDHACETGQAIVRKIQFNSNTGTNTVPYKVQYQTLTKLGINTIQMGEQTATIDAINQGSYTTFFNGQNTPTTVLYNNPPSYAQIPFDFSKYIGKWYVVASLGIANDIKSYTFYENSRGRFMLTNDAEPSVGPEVSVAPNFVGFVRGRDEKQGKMRTLTGLLSGDIQASLDPGKMVFSWIVHETDYHNYSLNGSPTRQEMVILSRKEKLCNTKQLLRKAKQLGYDVSNISTNTSPDVS